MKEEVVAKFAAEFGRKPQVLSYAPGRIEVLGNHVDYNEGCVLSAAIGEGTFFAVAPAKGRECRLVAGDLMKGVSFSLDDVAPRKEDTWQNYVAGTFHYVFGGEVASLPHGFDALFLGDVPQGAGLSSSAALEMSTAFALAKLYGREIAALDLAKAGQKAEHEFAGCSCGLLDQISSLAGKDGALILTDFRSLEWKTVSMGGDAAFLMAVSSASHALADGAYDERRRACETSAAHFAKTLRHEVRALRDVTAAEWVLHREGLDETAARRAIHPIGENERVARGVECLARGDLAAFGALMYDSHESSRAWFENSCAELDRIVEAAKSIPEILGARLSGGGFGGSCCVLVRRADAEKAAAALREKAGDALARISLVVPSEGARLA